MGIDDPLSPDPMVTRSPDLVVVDGYLLGPLVERLVVGGIATGLIDDNHELPIQGVRFVLNQNPHAAPELYRDATSGQRLLLGLSYALIRRDVVTLERRPRTAASGRPFVLVALGGADPLGITLGLAEALVAADCDVWVGVGATNPRRPEIEEFATARPGRVQLDGGDLLEGYASAELAVVGAGTTMWELGHLGIPGVAVVVADNQADGARLAADRGLVELIDVRAEEPDLVAIAARCRHLLDSPGRWAAMAAAGPALIDGHGPARAAAAIAETLADNAGADP